MALASVYFDVHLRCNLSNQAKINCESFYEFGYVQNIPRGHQKRSGIVSTAILYVTLHFRDLRSAASLRFRNRAEITVLMCGQKPYLTWFSHCWRKSNLVPRVLSYPPYGA